MIEAYKVLSNHDKRKQYNNDYANNYSVSIMAFTMTKKRNFGYCIKSIMRSMVILCRIS
jgi:curved DNA-binding protein CbpA